MSCRTGPLRVARAFHAFLTCRAETYLLALPLVGIIIFRPTGGPQSTVVARQGIHATKWPRHAQWARQAGSGPPNQIRLRIRVFRMNAIGNLSRVTLIRLLRIDPHPMPRRPGKLDHLRGG